MQARYLPPWPAAKVGKSQGEKCPCAGDGLCLCPVLPALGLFLPSHPTCRITPGELRPLPPTRNKTASVNISCHLFGLFLAIVLFVFLGKSKTNGNGVLGDCKWLVYEAGVSLTDSLAVFINALKYFSSLIAEGGLLLSAGRLRPAAQAVPFLHR